MVRIFNFNDKLLKMVSWQKSLNCLNVFFNGQWNEFRKFTTWTALFVEWIRAFILFQSNNNRTHTHTYARTHTQFIPMQWLVKRNERRERESALAAKHNTHNTDALLYKCRCDANFMPYNLHFLNSFVRSFIHLLALFLSLSL